MPSRLLPLRLLDRLAQPLVVVEPGDDLGLEPPDRAARLRRRDDPLPDGVEASVRIGREFAPGGLRRPIRSPHSSVRARKACWSRASLEP